MTRLAKRLLSKKMRDVQLRRLARRVPGAVVKTPTEQLLDWLCDAHAMEQQAEQMLRAQAARLEHHPEAKARIEMHVHETRAQQKIVARCIERLGGKISPIQDFTSSLIWPAVGSMIMAGEVNEASIAYAFAHLEIATYTTLIAVAEAADDAETVRVCRWILPAEEAMERWLRDNLTRVTAAYLQREMADSRAPGESPLVGRRSML
jgi:ferritin-like metal-binding protein YciE